MRLYEIDLEFQELLASLEENEGEITEELNEKLKINEEDFENKALNYRSMVMHLRSEVEAAKLEKTRVGKYQKSKERSIERLTNALDAAMKMRNLRDLDFGVKGKVSYRKSTAVSVIEDILSDEWFNETKTLKPNKEELKKALKEGTVIPGATLVENDNIQIK